VTSILYICDTSDSADVCESDSKLALNHGFIAF